MGAEVGGIGGEEEVAVVGGDVGGFAGFLEVDESEQSG